MKKNIIISLIVLGQGLWAQEKKYFDENWQIIKDPKKAHFYRETTPQGDKTLIKDYYIDGTLKMQVWAIDPTPNQEIFEGEVSWYYPNGKLKTTSYYKDNEVATKEYDEEGRIISDFIYKDGRIFEGKMHWYALAKDIYS